jgi:hypothetical protein
MTASLREAATMALDALELYSKPGRCDCCGHSGDCAEGCEVRGIINSLRAALAAPEAEPVAWKTQAGSLVTAPFEGAEAYGWIPLYAAPQPSPVDRQPLTDRQAYDAIAATVDEPESFEDVTSDTDGWAEVMEFIRAIEAAHYIKAAP